jgi:DMSO/TMAO reductase YedYZ heme-binding membrane subunit
MSANSNESLKKVAYYVGLFMVIVYVFIGLSLCFTNVFIDLIPRNRVVYGGIVLVYAVFRLYMSLRIRKSKETQQEAQ